MRFALVLAALLLPALAACDSSTPPAKAPVATPAVKAPAVKAPAAQAPAANATAMPAGARPLLGTFAANLADCGDATAVTTVTATSFTAPGRSCNLALTDNRDGSFKLACGGETMTLVPIFAPSGEGINIKAGSAARTTVLRCSR